MPDNAGPPITLDRLNCAVDSLADRPVLVVLSDQLRHPLALAVHGDEVADQVNQNRRLEHALNKHLVLRQTARRKILAIDCLPRREVLPASAERTRTSLGAVRDYRHLVPRENVRDLRPIGLDLIERAT